MRYCGPSPRMWISGVLRELQPVSADVPWKDSISHAVKLFRGTEYTISRPRDLWFAVTEMVSRIVKSGTACRASGMGELITDIHFGSGQFGTGQFVSGQLVGAQGV